MKFSFYSIGFVNFEFVTKNKYCYISAKNEFQDDFTLIAKIKKQSFNYIKLNRILQKYLKEYLLCYTLNDCFNSKKDSYDEIAAFRMSRKKILKEISKEEELIFFFIKNKNYAAAKSEIERIETLNRMLNLKMILHSNHILMIKDSHAGEIMKDSHAGEIMEALGNALERCRESMSAEEALVFLNID